MQGKKIYRKCEKRAMGKFECYEVLKETEKQYQVKAIRRRGYASRVLKSDRDNYFSEEDVKIAILKDRDIEVKNLKKRIEELEKIDFNSIKMRG